MGFQGLEYPSDGRAPGLAAVPSFPEWGKQQPLHGEGAGKIIKEVADDEFQQATVEVTTSAEPDWGGVQLANAMAHERLASRHSQKQLKQRKKEGARMAAAAAPHPKEKQPVKFKDHGPVQTLHDDCLFLEGVVRPPRAGLPAPAVGTEVEHMEGEFEDFDSCEEECHEEEQEILRQLAIKLGPDQLFLLEQFGPGRQFRFMKR